MVESRFEMNYLKTYFYRNKKVSPSSKSSSVAPNGSDFSSCPWNSQEGDPHNSSNSNLRSNSKSSPPPMGNNTPSRMGLVGSAKVIQILGAASREEAVDIITVMQRASPVTEPLSSFGLLEQSSEMEPYSNYASPCNSHLVALMTSYPDYVVDQPRYSWDDHYVSPRQGQRRNVSRPVSTGDLGGIGVGSGRSDHKSCNDSPQLSPHIGNNCQAHPLPTPPSSPSISGRKVMPKKLPPPPQLKSSVREFETIQCPQRMNPAGMQLPIQCSISPQQCPKHWSKGKVLGKGSFGTVYEALNLDDGSFFAVKISDVETAAPEVRQEIDVLKRLNHPNIVRYLGSSVDDGRLCIFLELVGMGSLRHVLDKYKQFEENMIRTYTRQLLWGLEYLHQQKTIHRDLKCANILVHPTGQVKLADFGVAKQMSQSLANSCKGTPLYMAPEMMTSSMEERKYGLAVDIWSLGCTIIEMADGKPPWSDLEGFSFFFKLNRGESPPIPDHLSPEAKNFLRMCLKLKPEERPSVSELLQHPFVTNAPAVAPLLSPCRGPQRHYFS